MKFTNENTKLLEYKNQKFSILETTEKYPFQGLLKTWMQRRSLDLKFQFSHGTYSLKVRI